MSKNGIHKRTMIRRNGTGLSLDMRLSLSREESLHASCARVNQARRGPISCRTFLWNGCTITPQIRPESGTAAPKIAAVSLTDLRRPSVQRCLAEEKKEHLMAHTRRLALALAVLSVATLAFARGKLKE